MMRYGIFADVHSNLEALEAVISACRRDGARVLYCAGDIVGYGANPRECIELFEKYQVIAVCGNHDYAASSKMTTDDFNSDAAKALAWTKEQLDAQHVDYLSKLPLTYQTDDFMMVHATLNNPEKFYYMTDVRESLDTFYLMERPVCFVGHNHVTQIFIRENQQHILANTLSVYLKPGAKYIVNVGSVSQPRDGHPESSYCIFDPDLKRIEIKRVPYDIATASRKVLDAGLPEILAKRLLVGQ
jgi:predicted phosphodiesterase